MDGITGTLSLATNRSATELTALLGTKTADAATVSVNATNMAANQLIAVAGGIAKVDSLTNMTVKLSEVDDVSTAALLGKAAATSASVDATGATAAEVTALLNNLGNVRAVGLSGALNLSKSQFDSVRATLQGKLAVSSGEPVLRVIGTSGDDTLDFSTWPAALRVEGGGGADVITLGSGGETLFWASAADSHGTITGAEIDTSKIDTISGAISTNILRFSTAAHVFGNGITFGAGTFTHSGFVTSHTANTLSDVWTPLNLASLPESTSAAPKLYVVQVTAGNLAGHTFMILNDHNATIDGNDMMIALVGTHENLNFQTGA